MLFIEFSLRFFKLRLPSQAWNKNVCLCVHISDCSTELISLLFNEGKDTEALVVAEAFLWFQKDGTNTQCPFFHYFQVRILSPWSTKGLTTHREKHSSRQGAFLYCDHLWAPARLSCVRHTALTRQPHSLRRATVNTACIQQRRGS